MRLAVDVMGGDQGPEELIAGIKLGLAAEPAIERLLAVGPTELLSDAARRSSLSDRRFAIVAATEVLTMDDDPALAIRRKKDSSILRAIELVREGEADVVISSGNTGALVAGATIRLGRLPGVKRPTLACVMPSRTGAFVLVDGGANPECTPEILLQFGIMGAEYSRAVLGVAKPRVGVISNGTEATKGTDLTRATVQLLLRAGLRCVGHCEGYDLFTGGVDVAVCDGFVGNIVLKTAEGLGKTVGALLRDELQANPLRRLGALLALGGLRRIKVRMNPDTYGGAPMLGLAKLAIKIHGGANRNALQAAIQQSVQVLRQRLNEEIGKQIALAAAGAAAPATVASA